MAQNITKRFDLNVGKRCNERCKFCYYLKEIESGNTKDLSTEDVKEVLRVGRRWGKTRVDLTGGEPTIRRDLSELIQYAKEIGYETICIITNGLVTSDFSKLLMYKESGLNDILVSLHAFDALTHDETVGVKNAHERVLQTMFNAKKLGINLRVNHVVNNLNYTNVLKLAKLVADYEPEALNFIVFNPTRDAFNADTVCGIGYHEISSYLREVLEEYDTIIPSINIRHMPFCFLKGFEKNVKTMWQLQYEKVEWDWCVDILHKRGLLYLSAATLVGMGMMMFHPRFYRTDWSTRIHDALQFTRIVNDRTKVEACRKCDLKRICDGVPKTYAKDRRGENDMAGYYDGQNIIEPDFYIPDQELEEPRRETDKVKFPNTPWMIFGKHR